MQPIGYYFDEVVFCVDCAQETAHKVINSEHPCWGDTDYHGIPFEAEGYFDICPIFELDELDYPLFCEGCDAYLSTNLTDDALDYLIEWIEPESELDRIVQADNLQLTYGLADDGLEYLVDLIEPESALGVIVHAHCLEFTRDRAAF